MDQARVRAYYDEFSKSYEAERRPNRANGYHAMIDDLELELCERYGRGRSMLECGCGTGLLLERMAAFAKEAKGIDLSPGMLELAKTRGLDVTVGSVTELPFEDDRFDVTCSFKVLAHVEDIAKGLSEMARVTKPGGVMLCEFYNALSLRGVLKRALPGKRIGKHTTTRESEVFTRWDAPWDIPKILPPGVSVETMRGVRIVTPHAAAMRVPGVASALRALEFRLADTKLGYFGGFLVAVLRKREA